MRVLVLVLGCAGVAAALAEDASAPPAPPEERADIMACAARNAPDRSFALKARFVTENEQEQSASLVTRLYGLYDEKSLHLNLMITEPPDLAGTAFYVREQAGQDDMRVFIPGLNRTRRVTGSMAARELWGTSFSYQDIKQMFGAFIGGSRRNLPDTAYMGRPVKALEIVPDGGESVAFERVELLFDAESCVPLAADYTDAEGEASKRLRIDPATIFTLEEHHIATDFVMTDLIAGKSTRVTMSDIRFDPSIPRSAFSSNGFHRAR